MNKQAFINGHFTGDISHSNFLSINPSTLEIIGEIYQSTKEDVNNAVKSAREAFDSGVWSTISIPERKKIFFKLVNLLEQNANELAILDTKDMGIPIKHSLNMNAQGAINSYRWYAEAIDKWFSEFIPSETSEINYVTREPIGVVGAITPWNVPLFVTALKIAPALIVGNSVILKPAEQSTLSALKLAELIKMAGIPDGAFNVLPGLGDTGKELAIHEDVDLISFTGSTEVGKKILKYAGYSNIKKICLECGGKSPHIIFDDYQNLAYAAQVAASSMFFNSGQTCIASSRLLIQENIVDEFLPLLCNELENYKPSDPMNPDCTFGPIVDEIQYNKVLDYIKIGIAEQAKIYYGGQGLKEKMGGLYIEPTIFINVNNNYRIAQEEIFGPVLCVITFKDFDEAIKIANNSKYGLGASVWTSNINRALLAAKQIRVGMVRVNTPGTGGIIAPFGGYKQSGIGRERSMMAFNEYTEIKSTLINLKSF